MMSNSGRRALFSSHIHTCTCTMKTTAAVLCSAAAALAAVPTATAFSPVLSSPSSASLSIPAHRIHQLPSTSTTALQETADGGDTDAKQEVKAAPLVSGAELEVMLTEWDEPLVVDAYATWCGPCLLMAPEFEAAAKELKGKVRFVKIDTDQEPEMAARLNIMGLPTLLFLDKFEPEEGSTEEAKAVLKDRIEGAIRKDSILALCDHHFFGGPRPEQL